MLNKEDKFIVITVSDVMTSDPRCVEASLSVEEVIEIFSKTNFAGLPVVDGGGVLVGIITQYDLVTKGSGIHIPTLVRTMEQVRMINPERLILEETLAPIKKLKVGDIMNNDPLYVHGDEPIEKAVESFAEHHKVNPLVVVDKDKKVIGVLSRHDLIKILAMKELGRAVNSAYIRQRPLDDSEQVVGETLRGIKKNFLFMPKYGVGKWIVLGASLFIIGLLASFLFIVKIPDISKDVERATVAQQGEAYLALRSKKILF
jgi:CBS domain-containing protein